MTADKSAGDVAASHDEAKRNTGGGRNDNR
jgi:hypothetical protein